ncbi:F0F1 ATP synthase subunit B [Flavobacteriales bacterium]|nr:F0F1 ATP synthase subunit B [Flavobacteriales bacterium]
MELVTPDIGLLFWMTTCFILLLFLLRKFAWGPILHALNEREDGIQIALKQAKEARVEVEQATMRASKLLDEAKKEKEHFLQLAKEELLEYKKEQQSKINAQITAQLNNVNEEILQQKRAAVEDLKASVAELSIEIAEKIIKKELDGKDQYNALIKQSVENLELN